MMKLDKTQIFENNGLTMADKIEMNWVDVPIDKKKVSITKHRFLNGGTTKAKRDEQKVVESGEVNFFFKFKIVSLERIHKLFEEIAHPVATDNKETVPRN